MKKLMIVLVTVALGVIASGQTASTGQFMQQLRGRKTFVGYIYGGIQASPYRFPYLKSSEPYNAGTVPTEPSGMILKVYVQAP